MPTRGQLAWDQVETRIGALVERLERLEEQVKDQSAHRVEERPRQDRDSRADEQEIDTLRLQLVQSRETVNLLLNRLDQAPQQPQTSDALKTHQEISRRSLAQRENFLTCPISLDLFDDPVTTNCCGKTFSSAALLEALARNPACPICRADRVSVVPNRDIAALVELHKSESAVLGVTETETMGDHSNNEDRSVLNRRSRRSSERLSGRHTRLQERRRHREEDRSFFLNLWRRRDEPVLTRSRSLRSNGLPSAATSVASIASSVGRVEGESGGFRRVREVLTGLVTFVRASEAGNPRYVQPNDDFAARSLALLLHGPAASSSGQQFGADRRTTRSSSLRMSAAPTTGPIGSRVENSSPVVTSVGPREAGPAFAASIESRPAPYLYISDSDTMSETD